MSSSVDNALLKHADWVCDRAQRRYRTRYDTLADNPNRISADIHELFEAYADMVRLETIAARLRNELSR